MNTLIALLKREILEHKNILKVPAILIGLSLLVKLSFSVGNFTLDFNVPTGLELDEVINQGVVSVVSNTLNGMNFIIMVAMFVVAVFYALSSLFNERQDDSVLFWRSLPISDHLTVASKAIIALLVVPLLIIACQTIIAVIFLGLDSFSYLLDYFAQSISKLATLVLWAWLPIISWCLFCSEIAKKNPFLLAFIAPIVFTMVDKMFLNGAISQTLIIDRFSSFSDFGLMPLLWGSLLSVVFLALAVVKRSQRI